MASERSSLKRLKALAKQIPDEPRIRGLLRVIENRHLGSDYAVAIVGASLVERALEVAILSRFAPVGKDNRNRLFDYEQKGPLADLAARSRMGMALGLYGPLTYADLEKIRHIRNLFAHSPSLMGFDAEAVTDVCRNFEAIDHIFRHETKDKKVPPKTNYVTACLTIAGRLRGRLENPDDQAEITFPVSDGLLP